MEDSKPSLVEDIGDSVLKPLFDSYEILRALSGTFTTFEEVKEVHESLATMTIGDCLSVREKNSLSAAFTKLFKDYNEL
jgi:hypothetical protein